MIIAAAGMAASIMAVGPQTTQDRAEGNRLIINGQPLFISGMNIAWNNFGSDVGDKPVQITSFVNQFKQIKGAGGNAVRWWLHTDAQNCPKLNDAGQVTGIGSSTIKNMQQVLDSAYAYGIVVSMCLFSFDLLKEENKASYSSYNLDRNYKFLTVTANLDTYIENALKPILAAVGNHPAVMCWEVFNEPEGMLPSNASGWGLQKSIEYNHIIRFTAKIAAAVHKNTKKMASTGIHGFETQTYFPNYTNAKLKEAAGGDNDAYLDFYMVHYYPEWSGSAKSPFHNPASFWKMDRPILIGEFPARDWPPQGSNWQTTMKIVDAYEYAYQNGYCGAMSWSMTENDVTKFGNFNTTKPALESLYAKHKTDIEVDRNVVIPEPPKPGSNLIMKLALTNLPKEGTDADGGPWNELYIQDTTFNFSGKTNFTFKMYIEPNSGDNLMIVPVIKTGDWVWSPAQDYSFMLSDKPKGEWFTVTIPVSAFKASEEGKVSDPSQVKGIIIQYFAKDDPYTGTIYFDDVKIDNTVLYDFNEEYSEWNTAADGASVSIVEGIGTSSIFHRGKTATASTSRSPSVVVKGKILSVVYAGNSDMRIKMVDMRGKTVANFKSSGSGQFSLTNIPAGRYLVETRVANKRVGSSAVIVK
jgi:hypothetical protein